MFITSREEEEEATASLRKHPGMRIRVDGEESDQIRAFSDPRA